MITLEERRKEAIEADKCFSKSTLKDEYRMKPSPTAQPAKYFKNGYGSEFGVYRIADCVPMREKRPATEKQILAGKQLAARSRMNSKKGQAVARAQAWLDADVLFIDTETTGLEYNDQVIELAVVDSSGQVLLDTRLKPTVAINPEALDVHEINAEALTNAPTWPDIAPRLRQLLEGRQVVAFNNDFDSRLLQQTALAFDDDYWSWRVKEHCAMDLAVQAFGVTNRYGSISLANSVHAAGIDWQGKAHSAAGDALTTLALVKAIADIYKNEDSAISFTHAGQDYKDVYRASWYQQFDSIELKTTQGHEHFSYEVKDDTTDLVAFLEASGITVLRR